MKKLILLIILSDIFTKYWVNMTNPDFSVIWNILQITHVKNTGVAFGTPLPGITFIIPLILVWLSVYVIWGFRKIKEYEFIGYMLIITGGILNALERTIFGSVTDFISVIYFSVFNVADIVITIGALLLVREMWKNR